MFHAKEMIADARKETRREARSAVAEDLRYMRIYEDMRARGYDKSEARYHAQVQLGQIPPRRGERRRVHA